ncbi:FoF1 ATP synthase subunit delta/epsilon [Capnocytophaga catalasegens]|uniref:ATP synthase F1 complex delta/epsilon subunit N-terminal domain-containing protein n=1 Tax=Capnocytophaga catalasegens TaxID=1004260 RepID=A0AAV5AYZ4_9FLAO|nr:F0F1 ATP synthase subunit epsilon [Capnocytophaga catalasegens]GIZ16433.1 hypothetical protein RCZ03_24330 [Capnocytophaga catalasegens]GJM50328.1 hypothetical protein RCZ15_13010 [Capnocytophaga catalasegens]GJM53845.1 hypothetical protein RCZ16_21610 [Capnocytophaga catalasegens]
MYIEVVTPEAILFKGKVTAVTLPSVKGAFQILENHAAIIAVLVKGNIKIKGSVQPEIFIEERFEKEGKDELLLSINSGIVEHKDNHAIILAE